jgi:hypothetical protein
MRSLSVLLLAFLAGVRALDINIAHFNDIHGKMMRSESFCGCKLSYQTRTELWKALSPTLLSALNADPFRILELLYRPPLIHREMMGTFC